jgi:hypothetical protein
MSQSDGGPSVTVQLTKEDAQLLEDLVDGSPFPQSVLLRLALRIGMTAIQKQPNVLLQFLAKEGKKPGGS